MLTPRHSFPDLLPTHRFDTMSILGKLAPVKHSWSYRDKRYGPRTGNVGPLAADADLSVDFGARLGRRIGRQTIRSFNPCGSLEREPAGLTCAFALRPAFPDEPRRFLPAVVRADVGGDPRSAHLWMEDAVRVPRLVVAAGNHVSRYLGPYSHHFLADDP